MASTSNKPVRIVDGQLDFSGGIDSGKPTTIATNAQPGGIPRNMVAWLTNATVRGGAIRCRTGWNLLQEFSPTAFQGGTMYEPDGALPYAIVVLGGHVLQVRVDTDNSVVDLSVLFGLFMPVTERCYFCQAEKWLVIQAGDNPAVTLPLFWDGTTLWRSMGITNPGVAPGTPGVNQIPPATAMCYYQDRLWYTTNYTVNAGDIIKGKSGTLANGFKDSVLNVTENPMVVGGDGFSVPTRAGLIRALAYTANIDATLGEGPLYIFTRKQVYQLTVPLTRADWIAANSTNAPQMTVAQVNWGAVNDWCMVSVNGDLYYRTLEPGVRSLILAIRYFTQFGNTPISRNMNRILQLEDRSLLHMTSGINFDNRLWHTISPVQTAVGIAFQGIGVLDFDILSSFQDKLAGGAGEVGAVGTAIPAWEGMYEPGLTLQLLEDDFDGLQRAFVFMLSEVDGKIQLWEATTFQKTDYGDKRVIWRIEFPACNWDSPFQLKELDSAELWIDKLFGTVDIIAEWREDANACWHPWTVRRICTARDPVELGVPGDAYPVTYCESGSVPLVLEKPQAFDCNDQNKRPVNVGCQHQVRLTITGWCQIRGFIVYALPRDRQPYQGLTCP